MPDLLLTLAAATAVRASLAGKKEVGSLADLRNQREGVARANFRRRANYCHEGEKRKRELGFFFSFFSRRS